MDVTPDLAFIRGEDDVFEIAEVLRQDRAAFNRLVVLKRAIQEVRGASRALQREQNPSERTSIAFELT